MTRLLCVSDADVVGLRGFSYVATRVGRAFARPTRWNGNLTLRVGPMSVLFLFRPPQAADIGLRGAHSFLSGGSGIGGLAGRTGDRMPVAR